MSTTIWIWVSDRNAKTTIAALSWQRDAVFSCRVTALPLVSPFTNFSSSACIKVVGLVPSYFYVPCGREYFWNPICTVTFIEGTELSSWIFFFAVSIDSIKGFPVILTSWIKWNTLLVKYSLPEKQKFSFNDKLFVSRYVRRLLTGHHCPQIGEGERGFFRRRREMKVGKSPQASNVCLLSWTMSPASHNSSGSRKRGGGWQRVGEFSRSLRAPPRSAPSPSGSTGGLPHVLPAGTSVSTRHWEHWRKQVPSDSLFPQKRQDENKTRSGKWRGRVELREDVIHG